jgi:hypothetical protein
MRSLTTLMPVCILAALLPLVPAHALVQDRETSDDTLIEPGKRIGQLSIGMTVQEVYSVMKGAAPTETMAYTNGSRLYKWGDSKFISVIIDVKTERVSYVGTSDPRFATKEGIRVGDTQFEVDAKMGPPQRRQIDDNFGLSLLWYGRRAMRITVQHGKVTSIDVWVPDK